MIIRHIGFGKELIMEILKNENVDSKIIKFLRKSIMSETPEVKHHLGAISSNITKLLPIRNRDFNLWVFYEELNLVGFLTFQDKKDDVKFIKEFYVLPKNRNKGFGKKILLCLHSEHPKLECKINPDNHQMYRLASVINLRGEKNQMANQSENRGTHPRWWSNYKSDVDYVS